MSRPGYLADAWEILNCLNEEEVETLNEGREKWLNRILSCGKVDLTNESLARLKLESIFTLGNCPSSLAALNALITSKIGGYAP